MNNMFESDVREIELSDAQIEARRIVKKDLERYHNEVKRQQPILDEIAELENQMDDAFEMREMFNEICDEEAMDNAIGDIWKLEESIKSLKGML